ncbi:MAG: hypothetical protein EAZ47_08850 [Bacteroidetes bacterium]|nr:MAG: hypothetical protein EAY72_08745 [Bacteroidota bacterium]TAE67152.1 MAG: hypothetical protein EAY68_05575 [Bacteroidota bacterium]TAF92342.1 MAG: hypothetical protein EAZ47_08850 [Bacteroidota bacterium]
MMRTKLTPWYFLPYFAISAAISAITIVFFLVASLTENELAIPVQATAANSIFNQNQGTQGNVQLYTQGKLIIKDANLLQRFVFAGTQLPFGGMDDIIALPLIALYFYVRRQLMQGTELRQNIAKALRLAGMICIVGYFVQYGLMSYGKQVVFSLTNNQFTWQEPARNVYLLWLGIVFIWFTSIYKKAVWLQQEQSLTV